MAKKAKITEYHCRDCMHHYGDYERDFYGNPFMCLCKKSEWAKMLDMPQCAKFKKL